MSLERFTLGFRSFKAALIILTSRKDPWVVKEYEDGSRAECLGGGYDLIGFKDDFNHVEVLPSHGTVFVRDPRGRVRSIMSTAEFASAPFTAGRQRIHYSTLTGPVLMEAFMTQVHDHKQMEIEIKERVKNKVGDPLSTLNRLEGFFKLFLQKGLSSEFAYTFGLRDA